MDEQKVPYIVFEGEHLTTAQDRRFSDLLMKWKICKAKWVTEIKDT